MGFYNNNNQANQVTQNIQEGALTWDSEISQESSFELYPAGFYKFQVVALDRDQFQGSEKMSPCPVANLTLKVENEEGLGGEIDNVSLFLHTKMEWKLSEFFTSIGQKKEGEPFKPNWNAIIGSAGYCELEVNSYVSKTNGKTYQNNRVKRWLSPKEVQLNAKKETPAQNFTPGSF